MKLYATVTSERASKGQGGRYLEIEILAETKEVIARINVQNPYPYQYSIDIFPVLYPGKLKLDVKGHGYELKRKGEKQKDNGCKYGHAVCLKDARGHCMDKS